MSAHSCAQIFLLLATGCFLFHNVQSNVVGKSNYEIYKGSNPDRLKFFIFIYLIFRLGTTINHFQGVQPAAISLDINSTMLNKTSLTRPVCEECAAQNMRKCDISN